MFDDSEVRIGHSIDGVLKLVGKPYNDDFDTAAPNTSMTIVDLENHVTSTVSFEGSKVVGFSSHKEP